MKFPDGQIALLIASLVSSDSLEASSISSLCLDWKFEALVSVAVYISWTGLAEESANATVSSHEKCQITEFRQSSQGTSEGKPENIFYIIYDLDQIPGHNCCKTPLYESTD